MSILQLIHREIRMFVVVIIKYKIFLFSIVKVNLRL